MVDWDSQPLGEVPDTVLAKRLGVSNVAVGRARKRRGIPTCGSQQRDLGCRGSGDRAGINWNEQPLGEVPDKALAARLGVDPSSVRSARATRGIPTCKETEKFNSKLPKKKVDKRKPKSKKHLDDLFNEALETIPERKPTNRPVDQKVVWMPCIDDLDPVQKKTCVDPSIVGAHEKINSEQYLPPIIEGRPHVHKCPVCNRLFPCDDETCAVDDTRVNDDGRYFGPYETCRRCKKKLESSKETTGQVVNVSSFGNMSGD